MSRLLNAGLIRLKQNRTFWILVLFMVCLGIYLPVGSYLQMKKYDTAFFLDNSFFTYNMLIGILASIFCGLFLGTEYSDGTIRNKLVIGHSRSSIYLSNLILSAAAAILFDLAYILPCICAGTPLLGFFQTGIQTVLYFVVCTLFITLAYAAIFTMIAMLIQNKAVSAVITIILAFSLMLLASYLFNRISQPEFYQDYVMNASGGIELGEMVPNEYFLRGTKRKVYEFLMEFLPSGQAVGVSYGSASLLHTALYDTIIIAFTTVLGIFGFCKKDIK